MQQLLQTFGIYIMYLKRFSQITFLLEFEKCIFEKPFFHLGCSYIDIQP